MDKPRLFVGSSSESLDLAEVVQEQLSSVAHCKVWPQGVFEPSGNSIDSILRVAETVDYAVFVFAADDSIDVRGNRFHTTRDNVILEFGIFLGRLGRERTFVVAPEHGSLRLPSDMDGLTVLRYSHEYAAEDPPAAMGRPCGVLRRHIRSRKASAPTSSRSPSSRSPRNAEVSGNGQSGIEPALQSSLGLERLYPSYVEAEPDILEDVAQCRGPVRLFLQIGNRDVAPRGAIAEALRDLQQQHPTDIRILHAGADSPLFAFDRLSSLGKDPHAIHSSLRQVNEALDRLERDPTTSVRHRTHQLPFFWRIYGLDKHLYLMPYVSNKNAHQHDPVLRFRRDDRSLYQTFTAWFDYTWDRYQPRKVRVEDYVTRATPAGAALFVKWEHRHVFAIPERDLNGQHRVRFYGIGGRRDSPDEDLHACALREGNEETLDAILRVVGSHHTVLWRADGTTKQVLLVGEELRPRLIMEKAEHTGRGFMAKQQDSYYVVAYDAELRCKPVPRGEVPALVFLTEEQLVRIMNVEMTLGELVATGGEIVYRDDAVVLSPSTILVPHGVASYVCRELSRERGR